MAVASLAVLVALFIACYALPPLRPTPTDIDYYALQSPPSAQRWFGTNAIGRDIWPWCCAACRSRC